MKVRIWNIKEFGGRVGEMLPWPEGNVVQICFFYAITLVPVGGFEGPSSMIPDRC